MPPDQLQRVLDAIADGRPVAWTTADAGVEDPDLRGAQLLDDIARAYRDTQQDTGAVAGREVLFRWGPLAVEAILGSGGFGDVYRAWDPWLKRSVALKLQGAGVAAARRADPLEEARRLARVRHRNVLAVYGCAHHAGRSGLWGELIDGRSFASILDDDGPLSAEESLRVVRDVALGLVAVHAVGLVHGDVKAANVMRERGGRIVLMDFGAGGDVAQVATRHLVTGTPAYLPPEVLCGASPDQRSDVYAAGIFLHALLTGTASARRLVTTAGLHPLTGRHHGVDATARALVNACTREDPAARLADAAALAEACSQLLAAAAASRHRSRGVGFALMAAFAAIALLVAGWWALLPPWRADAAFVRSRGGTDERLSGASVLQAGDRLRLQFSSSRESHVFVLNEDADGRAQLLFPDATADSMLPSGDTDVPQVAAHSRRAWQVTAGANREEFVVIASLRDPPALRDLVAEWKRTPGAGVPATRTLGPVVDDPASSVDGSALRAALARLPQDGSVRSWHFVFAQKPDS